MSCPEERLLWQEYVSARQQALADWQRVAFTSATKKTRDAFARNRAFLSRQP